MLKKQYSKTKPVCKVTFSLSLEAAAGAAEVKLLGDFNDWSWENGTPMKATKTEYQATVELATGRFYEFRYLLDNKTWVNDWDADDYFPTPYGVENSVVFVDAAAQAVAPQPAKAAESAKPAAKAPAKKAAKKAPAQSKKEVQVKQTAAPAAKDDLKKIEGIGPKIEGLLNERGIFTFADLAKSKKSFVQEILDAAGPRYKMHDPATWTEQAKLAAKGDWDKLSRLQDQLKGGKR